MILASLIGNLGRDAEVKNINGKEYLSFSVASTEKQGEQKQTTWVSVLAGNNPNLLQYLKKGQQVFVSGRMKAGIYQNNNNIGLDISVFASTLQLCVGKKEEQTTRSANDQTAQQQSQQEPLRNYAQEPSAPFPPTQPDDDTGLPF